MKIKYISVATLLALSLLHNNDMKAATAPVAPISVNSVDQSPFNYSKREVNALIRVFISEIGDVKPELIADESLIMNDLGLDSINMLELFWACQEFFEIDFNLADALYYSHVLTVADLTDIIYHFCQSDEDYKG